MQDYEASDYQGNNRVIGNAIDFGAIEYINLSANVQELNVCIELKYTPNPKLD